MSLPTVSPQVAAEREPTYRRNFLIFLSDYAIFGVGLSLIGATTVIPDFVRKLTDSEIVIALSSQLFEMGWLLPQLLVARRLTNVANKKWWFVAPNIPVRTVILIFSGLIVVLGPDRRSAILVLFLIFYALAALGDGLVGVPWMDLVGTSLDDRRRARLFGFGSALTGVAVLGLAPVVRFVLDKSGPSFPNNYALLFAIAGVLFLVTIPPTLFIRELPGGGKPHEPMPSLREYLPELGHVLHHDMPFRAIIMARLLAALYMLAAPFYIGFATERLGISSGVAVSNLLVMQTFGSVGGALIFSWLGERRTLLFIRFAMVIGMMQPALALLSGLVGPAPLYVAFLAGGLVGGTLGISFLNWVIAYPSPEQRPIYSGLFNSVSAISVLAAPLIGGVLVQFAGYEVAFAAALVMMASALFVATRYGQEPHQNRQPDQGAA